MHDEDILTAQQTYDLNEFLVLLYEEGKLNTTGLYLELLLHSCQYRGHLIYEPGVELGVDSRPENSSHAAC
jgi:hypothetical protein